ncbi:unnamed protein product [Lactuca saligna]|uniref:Uncharacterized protein n=1 Tax=Lactuca saligna TaxID=75948 RepID=A0AA35YX64_LACSI|nr:unnamed protein product [Lactuca saligna]
MANLPGIVPSTAEYRQLETTYGLSSLEGVEFPSPGSRISSPPPGKIGVFLKTLDAGIRFPLTEFQEEGKRVPSDYFVFKFFFRLCITGDKCTISVWRGGHALVPDGCTPKNWKDKWLWMNQELVGSGRYRANAFSDTIPKLFHHNQGVADYLKSV